MIPIRDTIPSRRAPLVTWGLIAATSAVFFYEQSLPEGELARLFALHGVVPARYFHPAWARWAGYPDAAPWPFLTFQFLHAGWFHVIMNMWALWIFGDNVEDRLGRGRFLLFYLAAGAVSGGVHAALFPASAAPTVGASGAVAGVMGAYWLMYPRSWVLTLVPVFFIPLFIEVPALVYIFFWFAGQLLSGLAALGGAGEAGGVAFWAHIGGFVFGMFGRRLFAPR